MQHLSPTHPLGFLVLVLGAHQDRARREERGASAVEWVVIAAIVVGIALAVGLTIRGALEGRAQQLDGEIRGS